MSFIRQIFILLTAALIGCTTPQIDEPRSLPSNAQFQINASIGCLYSMGVEHVSSYVGVSEPRFSWYIDSDRKYAWFRQPLTLVELRSLAPDLTEVRRSQTSSAIAFGQGNTLIAYLQSNPCKGI